MTLRSCFRVVIDTDARSPDAGHRLEVLLEAAPFGSAEACRTALRAVYRVDYPHAVVSVAEEPVLVAMPAGLAPGVYAVRHEARR